jgi:plastocyanin
VTRRGRVVPAALLAAGLVAAVAAPALAQSTTDVTMRGFAIDPEVVTVAEGDTVRWTNDDGVAHNVSGGSFSSGNFVTGSFSHTFPSAGTFDYLCTLHGSMRATLVVERAVPDPVIPEASVAMLVPTSAAVALAAAWWVHRSRLAAR